MLETEYDKSQSTIELKGPTAFDLSLSFCEKLDEIDKILTSEIPGLMSSMQFTRSFGYMDADHDENVVHILTHANGFLIQTGTIAREENNKDSNMNDPKTHLEYILGIAKDWYDIDLLDKIPSILKTMRSDYESVKKAYDSDDKQADEFIEAVPERMLDVLKKERLAHDEDLLLDKLGEYACVHAGNIYGPNWLKNVQESKLGKGIELADKIVLYGKYSERERHGEADRMEIPMLSLEATKKYKVNMDARALEKRQFALLRHGCWGIPEEGKRLNLKNWFENKLYAGVRSGLVRSETPWAVLEIFSQGGYGEYYHKAKKVLKERLTLPEGMKI